MDLRTALFDLDGTLTDPKPGITGCIQFALARLGLTPPSADELEWCIGPPLRDSFARLLNTNEPSVLDTAQGLYRERFAVEGLYENALYPGIPEALEALRAKGFRTYVATSKPRVFALRIIEHFRLTSLFDGVHGSELDGTRVDKAELIAHVLQVEGLGAAAMIGDREHDMVGGPCEQTACGGRDLWLRKYRGAAGQWCGGPGGCAPGFAVRPRCAVESVIPRD